MLFPTELFQKYKGLKRNAKRRINGVLNEVLVLDEDILKVDVSEGDMERIIKITKTGGENLNKKWNYGTPRKVYGKIVNMCKKGASDGEIARRLNMSIFDIQKITSRI